MLLNPLHDLKDFDQSSRQTKPRHNQLQDWSGAQPSIEQPPEEVAGANGAEEDKSQA
jgi:hypothetical protein